jgi:hypothetical protein
MKKTGKSGVLIFFRIFAVVNINKKVRFFSKVMRVYGDRCY